MPSASRKAVVSAMIHNYEFADTGLAPVGGPALAAGLHHVHTRAAAMTDPEFHRASLEQWAKAAAKSAPGGDVAALDWVNLWALALRAGPQGGGGAGWLLQLAAAVATDNRLLLQEGDDVEAWLRSLPQALRAMVDVHPQALAQPCAAVLLDVPVAQPWRDALARREGPILLCLEPEPDYCLERLIVERCVSVNVTATGGNASLLQLGEV